MTDFGQLRRFVVVGALGEISYLILFISASHQGMSPGQAVAIAGMICILINAELHARFSFRSRNSLGKMLGYAGIQLICLLLSALLAQLLGTLGNDKWLIGLTTSISWTSASFVMTRRLHKDCNCP
jgi:putative flippase GtrA